MVFSAQLLFFFSAIGVFNGLLLTGYLCLSKPISTDRRLLAALMLVISLRISKSIWFYFDPEIGKQFLQLGLSACFFIGPLLYFYIASVFGSLESLRIKWGWHLSFVITLVAGVGILFPYQSHSELWGTFYGVINWTWGLYIISTAFLIYPKIRVWLTDKSPWSKTEKLGMNVFLGTMLIWLAYFTATYTSYIVGALSFSFIFYLSILLWLLARNNDPQNRVKCNPSYSANKIDPKRASNLINHLSDLMEKEQLYKDPNLTLSKLAKKLHISIPQLSQLLNDNMQKSFAIFINEWRINESKRLLVESPRMTMDLVAEESGYNSLSTFYSAFKQFEKSTPAKYRQRHINP